MTGKIAAEFINHIGEHTLLWPNKIEAIKNWMNSDPEGKVEVAREFNNGKDKFIPQNMSEEKPTLQYIAGWFDSSGTISIHPAKNLLSVSLTSRSQELVTSIRPPETPLVQPTASGYGVSNIPHYSFQITGEKAIDFLSLIYPYSWIKKDLIDLAITEVGNKI